MAGSLRHVTNSQCDFVGMDLIENLGDAYECIEECVAIIRELSGGDRSKVAAAHWRYIESFNPGHGLDTSAEIYWGED